jgi:maltooligosyltrehalose trehalohydrolase
MLEIEGKESPMGRNAAGCSVVAECGIGARYRFHIGNQAVPDPASRMQSTDAQGPGVVTDPTAADLPSSQPIWSDAATGFIPPATTVVWNETA